MASWGEIEREAPGPAREARALLAALVHKTIATLHADAKPSGRVDLRELAVTRLTEAKDELSISWWSGAGGERRVTRR